MWTTYQIGLFLKRPIENLTKNRLGNPVTYDLMCLHLLFPTVKSAVLYLVSMKSYSKNTHPPYFKSPVTHSNKKDLIFYIIITILVDAWSNSIEKSSPSFLLKTIERKFPQAFYTKIRYVAHYFWYDLSRRKKTSFFCFWCTLYALNFIYYSKIFFEIQL
jgi:hypothetical protein